MARLPKEMFSQTISTDVGSGTRSGGQTGYEGLQTVAAGIVQLGMGAQQLIDARAKAKRENYLDTAQSEFRKSRADFKTSLDKEFNGTSYEGYANNIQEFHEEERKKYIEAAPDEEAQRALNSYFDGVKADDLISDTAKENTQANQFYQNSFVDNLSKDSSTLYSNPDFTGLYDVTQRHRASVINSPVYTNETKGMLLRKTNELIKSTLSGAVDRGGNFLHQARHFLDSETRVSNSKEFSQYDQQAAELLSALSPSERLSISRRIDNAIKTEQMQRSNEFMIRTEDVRASITDGVVTPEKMNVLSEQTQQLEKAYALNPSDSLKNTIIKNKAALVNGAIRQEALKEPLVNIREKLQKEMARDVKGEEDAYIKEVATKTYQDILNRWVKDPPAAAIEENANLKEGTREMREYIKGRGGNHEKIWTDAMERTLLSEFKHTDKPKETLDAFLAQDPQNAELRAQWIRSSSKENTEMARYAKALDYKDPMIQTTILMAPSDVQKTNGDFKVFGISDDEILSDLMGHHSFVKLNESFASMDDAAGSGAIFDAAVMQVKKNMIDRMPREKAVQQVAETMIDRNYAFITGLDGTHFALPAKYAPKSTTVQRFVRSYDMNYLTEDDFKTLNFDSSLYAGKGKRNETVKQFIHTLKVNGGRFELSDDGDHLQITYDHPFDGKKKLFVPQKDMDGNVKPVPFLIPLEDVINGRYKPKKPKLSRMNTEPTRGN